MPALAGAAIALALSALLATWLWRAPPSLTFSGWSQGDMPTYVCYGRMAASTTSTLSYASPHDVRAHPAPLLVNLPISSIGWLLALGVPAGSLEHVMRVLFGALMYLALGALLRRVFRPGPWFWSAFVLVGLGSGFAWLGSLLDVGLGGPELVRRWRGGVEALELSYYWWFLDTFRNLMYPLELAYHALIFGQLWALATRRDRASVVFYALACLSNPFVGIQATGVQIGSLALAWFRSPRASIGVLASSAAVAGLFGVYYGVVLPMDDVIRSLQEQHQAHLDSPLTYKSLLVGHGPALLAPLTLLDARFRREVWRRFHLVPVALLALWTAFLSQNSRFDLDLTLMPMHFTRGYLHASLWIIVLAWLQHRLAPASAPRRGAALAAVLALITLPDAALFVEDQYRVMPHNPTLVWPAEWEAVHAELRQERHPRRVLVNSYAMGRQVCALHDHRSAIGTPLTTPHYDERQAELDRFRRDPSNEPPMVAWADRVIAHRDDAGLIAALRRSQRWRLQLENGAWVMFRRTGRSRGSH